MPNTLPFSSSSCVAKVLTCGEAARSPSAKIKKMKKGILFIFILGPPVINMKRETKPGD
jgi:hypothetical protein